MYVDKGNYLVLDDLLKYGVYIVHTDKDFGDAKTYNKENMKKILGIKNKTVVSGHQIHGTNIELIKNTDNLYFEKTDGFITNLNNVALFTKYADCLPIFFYDKKNKIIGVVHSGWKGTFENIGIHAMNLLISDYNSQKEDIIIAFGIGISCKNYEVGEEFYEKFKNKFSSEIIENSFLHEKNKIYFDNQKFNYLNFVENLIPAENIIANEFCTFDDQRFFSHRRDNTNLARNGALIFFGDKLSI